MFWNIFTFEIKYKFTKISTYVFNILALLLGFFIIVGASGAFSGVNVSFGFGSSETMLYNGPFFNHMLLAVFSMFATFIIAAFVGNSVYRDYQHKSYMIFFTKPVSKISYLIARYAASVLLAFLIMVAMGLGMYLATLTPWVSKDLLGPAKFMYYAAPYLTQVLPTFILTGAIFLSLIILTRKMAALYVSGIILMVLNGISSQFSRDLDTQWLSALLDPFGVNSLELMTKYWTVAEKNTMIVPLESYFLMNRIVWLGISVVILAFSIWIFRFAYKQRVDIRKLFRMKPKAYKDSLSHEDLVLNKTRVPVVSHNYSVFNSIRQFVYMCKIEISKLFKSPLFIVLGLCTLAMVMSSMSESGQMYDTPLIKVTYIVIGILTATVSSMSLIIVIIFSGELIWRDREKKIDLLIDSTPVRTWVMYLSKFIAVMFIPLVLYTFAMLIGIITQMVLHVDNIDMFQYTVSLGKQIINISQIVFIAFFVHSLINNKYAAHLAIIVFSLLNMFLATFGLEHPLWHYGKGGSLMYSDMNGYGNFWDAFLAYEGHWLLVGLILLFIAEKVVVRGRETGFLKRIKAFPKMNKPSITVLSLLILGMLSTGGWIFYNVNVVNDYTTNKEGIQQAIDYEKTYKKYDRLVMPRFTDVYLEVDIFPEIQGADARGKMVMVNKSDSPIDTLYFNVNSGLEMDQLEVSAKSKRVHENEDRGIYILELENPMMPGDSMNLEFAFKSRRDSFYPTTSLCENGTFLNNKMFTPGLGYSSGGELGSKVLRKKHGLPPKPRMAKVDDDEARMNTYISEDSDWVNFEAVVSTSKDQIAVAPGYLQSEWVDNDRRYFHYKMDHPILHFFSFVSARYEVKKQNWTLPSGKDVSIEIYYDKKHPYNIDTMIRSLEVSLDYYSNQFGEYPHKQVRILEFPRYGTFAQSFPNTIPYSEGIGFIADTKRGKGVDYPFNITAHELAHQWWAHQVIGADVQGAVLMSEALAQYSALMVLEKEHGEDQMKTYLKHELDSYLKGRGYESRAEMPLYLVENQQYLHYNKGSVVMYALKDYIGEEALNSALKKYVAAKKWQKAPYTNSIEFLEYIREATPDSLQYMVTDMFEKITIFDNMTESAEYHKLEDGRYEVVINTKSKKFYADSLGVMNETVLTEWIDVGVFAEKTINGKKKEVALYLKKHKVSAEDNTFSIIVDSEPEKAGLDPLNKLIDRDSNDNLIKVKKSDDQTTAEEVTRI